jgi:ADP-heptose:LPS heptosyltransferase
VEVHLPPDAAARAAAILARAGIGGRPFAVVAPGGRSSERWPAARFAALARRLGEEHGLAVVVTGAPDEADLVAEVARGASGDLAAPEAAPSPRRDPPAAPSAASEAAPVEARSASPARRRPPIAVSTDPILDLAALLGRARLLVANDSAPIHLAEATGTPTLYFAQVEKLAHSRPAGGERCRALWDDRGAGVAGIAVGRALAAVGEMAAAGLLGRSRSSLAGD